MGIALVEPRNTDRHLSPVDERDRYVIGLQHQNRIGSCDYCDRMVYAGDPHAWVKEWSSSRREHFETLACGACLDWHKGDPDAI